MSKILTGLCLVLALAAPACGQLNQLTAAQVDPAATILDFEVSSGCPGPGPISNFDGYFLANGLLEVFIVNQPGTHTASGDVLSSGQSPLTNILASVGNQLSIVAPSGAMDNQGTGAGWGFRFGSLATQVAFHVEDQTNNTITVETYVGGVLQNSLSGVSAGTSFPNPLLVFEDLAGFDEVRIFATTASGGWGIDNFHFNAGCPGGVCPPVPAGPWQRNSPDASMDINGLAAPSSGPILYESCPGTTATINVNGLATPYDIVYSPNPAVSNLGWLVYNAVNVNPFDPFAGFLLGFAFSPGLTLAPGAVPVTVPFGSLSTQLIVQDPASPEGIRMSAPCELRGGAVSIAGPTADDTPITVDVSLPPFGLTAGVNFNASSYTTLGINPNGRVMMGIGDSDFSPTVSEFLSDAPSMGVWGDLAPHVGGSISIGFDCTLNQVIVSYLNVPWLSTTGSANTFDLIYDANTGDWTIQNLSGVQSTASTSSVLIGYSPGNGATDPGPADFTQGGGVAPNPFQDAYYEFGAQSALNQPGGVLGGPGGVFPVNAITFTAGGIWFSF